jgi:hypothetical protein
VYLQLTDANGQGFIAPVEGPGGQLVIGVGGPGKRSSVWRIRGNRRSGDVYIQNVEMPDHHYSLHQSGRWHHAFQDAATARQVAGTEDRFVDQWRRPEEMVGGWTRSFSIRTTAEDIIDVPDDRQTSPDITWLPAPEPHHWVGIHVVICHPDQGEVTLTDATPFRVYQLGNGEVLFVIISYHMPTDEQAASLDSHRQRLADEVAANIENLDELGAPRSAISVIDDESAGRGVWDLAVRPNRL